MDRHLNNMARYELVIFFHFVDVFKEAIVRMQVVMPRCTFDNNIGKEIPHLSFL